MRTERTKEGKGSRREPSLGGGGEEGIQTAGQDQENPHFPSQRKEKKPIEA